MFGNKKPNPNTIDCLIGQGTTITGDLQFRGGLRIDGQVSGRVIAEPGEPSILVLSENARIVGEVRAAHLVINGSVEGPIRADELVELQPKARVRGDVHYKTIEMHNGAVVDGALAHIDDEKPGLKLAASSE